MAQEPRREWLENAMARWEKPILRLCYAFLGDTTLAEDAVQETGYKMNAYFKVFINVETGAVEQYEYNSGVGGQG